MIQITMLQLGFTRHGGRKGERYLASGRQYGNALLGVRHQEEEAEMYEGRMR